MDKREHRKQTLSFFRDAAENKGGFYDSSDGKSKTHSIWQRLTRYMIRRRLEKASPPLVSVVDVGCGNGDFLQDLARRFPSIQFEGRDLTEEMIEVANSHPSPPNLRFAQADLLEVDEEDPKFDCVLCHNMIHHLHPKDLERGLLSLEQLAVSRIILELKPRECLWNRFFRPTSLFPLNLISRAGVRRFFAERGFELEWSWNIFWLPFFSPISVLEFRRSSNGRA